jgi:phosphate:Na+ symporter
MLLGGLFVMRFGLQKVFSHSFQRVLITLTLTPWRGLVAGTVAAALMQSSTALTLITVGLVSAGYLPFYQSLGIILGANIGTCSTVQLLTLSAPPEVLLVLALATGLMAAVWKKGRWIGLSIAGMAAMFGGVSVLAEALGSIPQTGTVVGFLAAAGDNPLYGIVGGILLTFFCQSSSAATGLLMVLAQEEVIDLTAAVYGVYGNNIGSCLSSVLVGATAPLAAKRVAMSHILLNVAGVMIFFPFSAGLAKIATWLTGDFAGQVAMVHTVFNIASSLAVLPVIRRFALLIAFLVPGDDS